MFNSPTMDELEGWVLMSKVRRLVLTVKEVRGRCPVHKVGDRIVVKVPKIDAADTDILCVHALGSMLSMLVALA